MTLESKENNPWHTKTVQNSLSFMPEVIPLHKPCGDLVLCALGVTCPGSDVTKKWGIILVFDCKVEKKYRAYLKEN